MCADDGADIRNKTDCSTVLLCQHGGKFFRLVFAVAVAEKHDIVYRVYRQLGKFVHQCCNGVFSASHLTYTDQSALVVHMDDGLDAQHIAHDRRRGADASAPLEVNEILCCDPMGDPQLQFLDIGGSFLKGCAGKLLLLCQIYQHSLSGGGRERVHCNNCTLGVLTAKLLRGNLRR